MEDPWANAWQEPQKPAKDSQNTWSRSQDAETDIANPSWVTGAGVKWAEPSDTQESLWNSQLPVREWNPSPYDTIALGKASQTKLSQPDRSPSPTTPEEISLPPLPSPAEVLKSVESASLPDDDNPPITRSRSPTPVSTHSHPSIPGSPDAFGTFETGLDVDEVGVDPWGHSADLSAPAFGGTDAPVPTWGEDMPKVEVQVDSEPVDEWEAAKQRKERQDLHVPPEVLESILHQFEELANDLWPKPAEHNDTSVPTFRHGQESGIEGIEGIMDIADRLIPEDLTLPQYVQFSRTFTSKHMNEALRLTRHMEATRSSPMALYMASKGSTAWEASVKSRPEVLQDDVLPPGWRIIEKEEPTSATENKKKAGGSLLSLFGRRGPTLSSEASPGLVDSTRSMRTPPPGTGSPRASVDGAQPLPSGPVTPSTPVRSLTSVTASSNRPFTPPPAPPPLPQTEVFQSNQPTSAVSRFLNRFSRKLSGSAPRNSLALSSDDLEFLSDIVPSATEEEDEDLQLKGLTNMIASTPLPTKLPPPLAPPPRASALPTRGASSRTKSPTLDSVPSPLSISRPEAPNTSSNQQASIIPAPLAFPDASMASSSTSYSSPLAPASFKTASRPGSTFSSPPSRSHSPLPSKRTPVAIMATSSVIPTSSTFNFPPPPSSTQPPVLPPPRNAVRAPILTPNPLPASGPSSPTSWALAKPSESANGREFSDFHRPSPRVPAAFDTSISQSAFSDDNLMPSSSSTNTSYSNDLLDDFDDFVSSPLRTPSPPHLPTKPTSFGHRLSLSRQLTQLSVRTVSPDKPQPPPPSPKISRAANHQRTQSLVEIAAARPGRWPAPPSPLPEAIPPPGAFESSVDSDLLAGGSTMQGQQTVAVAGMGTSVSSPAYFSLAASALRPPPFPPVPISPSSVQLRAVSPPVQPEQRGFTGIPATSSRSSTSGGLSAQDLSFFEGL